MHLSLQVKCKRDKDCLPSKQKAAGKTRAAKTFLALVRPVNHSEWSDVPGFDLGPFGGEDKVPLDSARPSRSTTTKRSAPSQVRKDLENLFCALLRLSIISQPLIRFTDMF